MSTVRVKADVQSVVYDRDNQTWVTLRPGDPYDSRDALVREFSWAFESDIESATARPGEKRNLRRSSSVSVADIG